jgi:hypothetical protein
MLLIILIFLVLGCGALTLWPRFRTRPLSWWLAGVEVTLMVVSSTTLSPGWRGVVSLVAMLLSIHLVGVARARSVTRREQGDGKGTRCGG